MCTFYSYIRFIDPASKVSVPFTLVILTAVSTAPRDTSPPPCTHDVVEILPAWLCTQTFPEILNIVIEPENICDGVSSHTINPAVELPTVPPFDVDIYPDVVYVGVPPVPSCTNRLDVPLHETPLNITVIRLTQLGIDVKLMLVPDVLATAVPLVSTLDAIVERTAPEMLGEVPNTTAPLPVLVVTPVPPLATGSVPVTCVVSVIAPLEIKLPSTVVRLIINP